MILRDKHKEDLHEIFPLKDVYELQQCDIYNILHIQAQIKTSHTLTHTHPKLQKTKMRPSSMAVETQKLSKTYLLK